jgi:hypothetical protein
LKATPTNNRKALSQNDNCSVRSASSTASSASKTKTKKPQKTLSNDAKQSKLNRKSETSIENANENCEKMNQIQSTTYVEESQPSSSTSGATASTATIEVTDSVKKAIASTMVTKRLSSVVTDIIDTEFNTKIDLVISKTQEQITDELKIKTSMQIPPIDSNPSIGDSQQIIMNEQKSFTDPLVKQYFMVLTFFKGILSY